MNRNLGNWVLAAGFLFFSAACSRGERTGMMPATFSFPAATIGGGIELGGVTLDSSLLVLRIEMVAAGEASNPAAPLLFGENYNCQIVIDTDDCT
ncbi:MAG: hypothetical protein AB1405_16875, partial [Bdellovibrionota bacterium]